MNALTMGVAAQYAAKGIRCNAIAPGMLSTPMVQSAHKDNHFDLEEMVSSRDNAVPMRWQGEGWDVGELPRSLPPMRRVSLRGKFWWSMAAAQL